VKTECWQAFRKEFSGLNALRQQGFARVVNPVALLCIARLTEVNVALHHGVKAPDEPRIDRRR
jgi:hypothetical protein